MQKYCIGPYSNLKVKRPNLNNVSEQRCHELGLVKTLNNFQRIFENLIQHRIFLDAPQFSRTNKLETGTTVAKHGTTHPANIADQPCTTCIAQ